MKYIMLKGTRPMKDDLRAIDWAENGKFIIAADVKGMIYLFDPYHLKLLDSKQSIFCLNEPKKQPKRRRRKKLTQWIEDIKISPNC